MSEHDPKEKDSFIAPVAGGVGGGAVDAGLTPTPAGDAARPHAGPAGESDRNEMAGDSELLNPGGDPNFERLRKPGS